LILSVHNTMLAMINGKVTPKGKVHTATNRMDKFMHNCLSQRLNLFDSKMRSV
jgi:hypothetical protein